MRQVVVYDTRSCFGASIALNVKLPKDVAYVQVVVIGSRSGFDVVIRRVTDRQRQEQAEIQRCMGRPLTKVRT